MKVHAFLKLTYTYVTKRSSIFFINVYIVLFLFHNVIYVFLLLSLRILIVCLCMTTLTEVFPCFFHSCKANARVKPANFRVVLCIFCVVLCIFVLFYVLFCDVLCIVCICVLNYCHRVATQLQLNISYSDDGPRGFQFSAAPFGLLKLSKSSCH
jgi:hypothetical protein